MKRIIGFRFHDNFEVCENRLQLAKSLNPDVPIYGIFGGDHSRFTDAKSALGEYFNHTFEIPISSKDWKWRNGDLSLGLWYQQVGKNVDFDMLHLIEWDLLVLDNLDSVYSHVPKGAVGLTALTPLGQLEDRWWWISGYNRKDWNRLVSTVESKFGPIEKKYGCQGPANCFSREFLERYSLENAPDALNEEVRLPLYASAFGIELCNNSKIYKRIFDLADMRFFNCENYPVGKWDIENQLSRFFGKRVFHPYKEVFESDLVPNLSLALA